MAVDSGYVTVNRQKIYREIQGTGDSLVFLHGGLGTVLDFRYQTPEFAKYYRTISFERPGHGRSEDPGGEFDFNRMRDDTVSFLEHQWMGPYTLVGYSDGGIVALLVAISRPDLVKNLVIIGSNYDTKIYDAKAKQQMMSITAEGFRRFMPDFMKLYDSVTPNPVQRFPVQLEKTKKLWTTQPDIPLEDLGKISARTLILAGDHEDTPTEHTVQMFRAIKGAELCIIPGASHGLLSDRAADANAVILGFLARSRSSDH